jgi:hypothetical protein
MAHYSAMKRNEVLIHATSMNLKNVNENDEISRKGKSVRLKVI